MPMDPDAREAMALIDQMVPLPGPGADPGAFRMRQEEMARAAPAPLIEIERVETFSIETSDGPLRLRFYCDAQRGSCQPTMIYMHGGGFVLCSIDTHDAFCRRLARESGWAVLSVDYRLAPEHPYPAGFEDGYAALTWAASDAGQALGIDPERLAVGGDSAGGALAAALTLAARDRGGPALRHQLLIYPVIDNRFTRNSFTDNAEGYYLTASAMRWFWEQYLGEADMAAPVFAAPGRAGDLSGLPSATIVTAGFDPLRDEGREYADRLRTAGVKVAYRCMDGGFHGFMGMAGLACEREASAFILQNLRASA